MNTADRHVREISGRRIRPSTYIIFFAIFTASLLLSHSPFLRLPYFWDEATQFIPASADLYQTGAVIAHSVTPNIHPPGLMLYLAGAWRLSTFSPPATRTAMLVLAAFGLLAAFLLAIELSKDVPGMPAFLAVALLFVSPIFFAQSMLAQLDAPAMLFTTLALVWFLQDRIPLSAAATVALVLTKETGLVVPLVFAAWLARERRWREAGYFLAPLVVLASWVAALFSVTGHWAGNAGFVQYNIYYPLHPARVLAAAARRLYFLFVVDFRWVGTIALLAAWRKGRLRTRAWRIAFSLLAVQTALFCICGGAVLDRYLLPVMPVLFAAMAAALALAPVGQRAAASAALVAGSIAGNFLNAPYAYPIENNLAFTDFIQLQSEAADYLSEWHRGAEVTTAWPLAAELRRPEMGYVKQPLVVHPVAGFAPTVLAGTDWSQASVVVVYSRGWDPPAKLMPLKLLNKFRERFYGFIPEATAAQARARVPFPVEQHFERHGQWLDVYVKPPAKRNPTAITVP
jgi:hypothetical protein